MRSPDPTASPRPRWRTWWGTLAVLTCPCHLPILIALSGTMVGAFVTEHEGIALLVLLALFVFALLNAGAGTPASIGGCGPTTGLSIGRSVASGDAGEGGIRS